MSSVQLFGVVRVRTVVNNTLQKSIVKTPSVVLLGAKLSSEISLRFIVIMRLTHYFNDIVTILEEANCNIETKIRQLMIKAVSLPLYVKKVIWSKLLRLVIKIIAKVRNLYKNWLDLIKLLEY